MEDIIGGSWQMPLSGGKVVVDSNEMKNNLKRIRDSLPGEVIKAREIVENHTKILEETQKECEKMFKSANEKIREMINENEITKLSKQKAEKILSEAESQSKVMISKAEDYLEKLLSESEALMKTNLVQIKSARQHLKSLRS
jgi:hypothetical protein